MLYAVADPPVGAHANAGPGIPRMAFAQRSQGLGVNPAVRDRMGGLGVNAGDFGNCLAQFGADAQRVVVEGFTRPIGAGLHGSALDRFTCWFGRLARQPGDAAVRAAGRVPLRSEGNKIRLHRQRKRQHQGPAGRYLHAVDPSDQSLFDFGVLQQLARLSCTNGQQHGIKTRQQLVSIAAVGVRADRVELQRSDSRSMRVTRVCRPRLLGAS